MNFTDTTVKRIYNNLKCAELRDSLDSYPEDERNGREDLQILAEEINYYRSCYEEDGHALNYSLLEAKELLKETRNGKCIPIDKVTLKPKRGYAPYDIESAKYVVAEYKQLQYYEKQLKEKGYRGNW